MKKLVALLLLASYSYAGDTNLMVMQYNENVRIVLSKEKCPVGEGFVAVAQRIDKEVMKACWTPKGNLIHIQWEGGDFSDFDVTRFYPVEIK
jgi:hypothetical protein